MNRVIYAFIIAVVGVGASAQAQNHVPPGMFLVRLFEQVQTPNNQTTMRALFDSAFSTAPQQGEYLQLNNQMYRVLSVKHILATNQFPTWRAPSEDHLEVLVSSCPSAGSC